MSAELEQKPLAVRLRNFVLFLGTAIAIVYGVLPALTNAYEPLARMNAYLDKYDIDPSRYYFSDVPVVSESEQHIRNVMDGIAKPKLPE